LTTGNAVEPNCYPQDVIKTNINAYPCSASLKWEAEMDRETKETLIPAAEYVRGSTERQEYSPANQSETNHVYASVHNMQIVQTYYDKGKSGLVFDRRDGLRQLIEDVLTENAQFKAILVYDVSRWGRFQDPDESAYYEYSCKRAGIAVHYCAEPFVNDGSPLSALFKALKRTSAADYSRELSAKVFAAHARLVKFGYAQGGAPSYGLRRLLIDRADTPKFPLERGEQKAIATDRVVLVPGPPKEVETVRRIFDTFVHERKSEREIAELLNKNSVPTTNGRPWTRQSIVRVLNNERYIGNYVWNRKSTKLKGKLVSNTRDKWIRVEGVIEPILDRQLFMAAQEIVRNRQYDRSLEEFLEPLRGLLCKYGFLSRCIIDKSPGVPSGSSYYRRFGGLIPAYQLVGFTDYKQRRRRQHPFRSSHATTFNLSNEEILELLRPILQKHGYVCRKIIDETNGIPAAATYYNRFGSMKRVCQLLTRFPEHPGNRTREQAQSRVNAITYNLSDDQLINMLRQLLLTHGSLTKAIIDANKTVPRSSTYVRRFGSMARVYQLLEHTPKPR
jgi:DNA invertase Pin-like site-specific DNA recombinase